MCACMHACMHVVFSSNSMHVHVCLYLCICVSEGMRSRAEAMDFRVKSACECTRNARKSQTSMAALSAFDSRRHSAATASSVIGNGLRPAPAGSPESQRNGIGGLLHSKATLHTPYSTADAVEDRLWPKRINRPQTTPGRLRFADLQSPQNPQNLQNLQSHLNTLNTQNGFDSDPDDPESNIHNDGSASPAHLTAASTNPAGTGSADRPALLNGSGPRAGATAAGTASAPAFGSIAASFPS